MNGFILIPLLMMIHGVTTSILSMWHRTVLFNEVIHAREKIDQRRILLELIHAGVCDKVAHDPSFFSQDTCKVPRVFQYKDDKKKIKIVSFVQKRLRPKGEKHEKVLSIHTIASDNKKHTSSIKCHLTLATAPTEKEKIMVVVSGHTFVNLM